MWIKRSLALFGATCLAFTLALERGVAQDRDTSTVETSRPPKVGNQPGKNVPPGKEHAGADELYRACLGDLNECNERAFTLGQKVKQLEAENAKLKTAASLPVCHDRHVWKHPTIADVSCYPHACAPSPFACVMYCKSQLDCAPGRSCTAQGLCAAPIK